MSVKALAQLKQDMGFDQLRFYCRKKKVGRTFHIMTNRNSLGYAAVRFIIEDTSSRAQACGSFTALPDDNSKLTQNCRKWGYSKSAGAEANLIGHSSYFGNVRIYHRFAFWQDRYYTGFIADRYWCDDNRNVALSTGDVFEIFVR